jgi:hypothetical protein
MKNKNLVITGLTGLALVVGLATAVSLVRQRQIIDTPAAVPSGTSTINITPANPTLFVGGQPITLTANLNTGTSPITGYQVIASYTYTGATPPVEILGTAVNITNTNFTSPCIANTITHDTAAKRFTITVACGVPLTNPLVPYSTNNTTVPLFTFDVKANTIGSVTLDFDNSNSIVTSSAGSQDVLTFPVDIQVSGVADTQAPAAITNLTLNTPALNSLNLAWTAPSDVGPAGKAATYEIRYSTSNITDANFSSASLASAAPVPGNAGTSQTYSLSGLNADTTYFVAIKSRDASGNLSAISNVPSLRTLANPSLTVSFKFQNVSTQKPNKNITVILKQSSVVISTYNNISATSNPQGVYTATIPNINPGTYDVVIKGPVHLGLLVPAVQLVIGTNTVNWPSTLPELKAGDISGNNFIDLSDYSLLAGQFAPGVSKIGNTSDLNFNDFVDITDYSILAGNFAPGVRGAE